MKVVVTPMQGIVATVSFPTISIIDPDQARPPNWPSRRPSARTGGLIVAREDHDAARVRRYGLTKTWPAITRHSPLVVARRSVPLGALTEDRWPVINDLYRVCATPAVRSFPEHRSHQATSGADHRLGRRPPPPVEVVHMRDRATRELPQSEQSRSLLAAPSVPVRQ